MASPGGGPEGGSPQAANEPIGLPSSRGRGEMGETGEGELPIPAIVPAPVLARARPAPGPAPSATALAPRPRHGKRGSASRPVQADERPTINEATPAPAGLHEGATPAALREGAATPIVTPGPGVPVEAVAVPPADRLVAVQDAQTVLVTDPSRRIPRAVRVGQSLPSGARLLSADPVHGRATTDRGPLELR